jgi:hypothetical protein
MSIDSITKWLLEDDNLCVKYRALTELLDKSTENEEVIAAKQHLLNTLPQAINTEWIFNLKGLRLSYNLVALAECGINKYDIDISSILTKISRPRIKGASGLIFTGGFDANCNDALIIRALVSLGYKFDKRIFSWLKAFSDYQLPDGGILCSHWRRRFKYTPKSCMKVNMHILLMLAECKKQGLELEYTDRLIDYFLKRKIFYRSDNPNKLVLPYRRGKRMIDNFFPSEPFRVGLPQLLYAFSILGAGNAPELKSAWELLENKKDQKGRYILEGSLSPSYLPRERVGKASKWVTLYALLSKKYKSGNRR